MVVCSGGVAVAVAAAVTVAVAVAVAMAVVAGTVVVVVVVGAAAFQGVPKKRRQARKDPSSAVRLWCFQSSCIIDCHSFRLRFGWVEFQDD